VSALTIRECLSIIIAEVDKARLAGPFCPICREPTYTRSVPPKPHREECPINRGHMLLATHDAVEENRT
jgi:hypothetical protein